MEDSTLEKDKNVTPQEQQEQMNNTIKVTEENDPYESSNKAH